MSQFEHLCPDMVPTLRFSKVERIAQCRKDVWVPYPSAEEALLQIEARFNREKASHKRHFRIVTQSGNGKSMILDRFINMHKSITESDGELIAPVVCVELPVEPSERDLWSKILWNRGISHQKVGRLDVIRSQVKDVLQEDRVRMLMIDEFNNLSTAKKKRVGIVAALCELAEIQGVSIIAAETQCHENLIASDRLICDHFDSLVLPTWSYGQIYREFLNKFERWLPFPEPSRLSTPSKALRIYEKCGGVLGDTVTFIKEAAAWSIANDLSSITTESIDRTPWFGSVDWAHIGGEC